MAAADAAATAEAVTNEPCGKAATAIYVAVAAGFRIETNSRTRAEWIAEPIAETSPVHCKRPHFNPFPSLRQHSDSFTLYQAKCTERKIDELKQF